MKIPWLSEFLGLVGGSHHAFSPWLPEVGEGLRLLATLGGENNTGLPMRLGISNETWEDAKAVSLVNLWMCFFVQTVDGKRDGKGTSDLWLKAWGMFDVGCPYLKDAKVESEAVNFLILILQPKMWNHPSRHWQCGQCGWDMAGKSQVILCIILLMDKIPQIQLIW